MTIAFPHEPQTHGGPSSFQIRIENVLKKRGWKIIYANNLSKEKPDVVFVVGGTRKIGWLIKQKLSGIPVILRLDGMNWLHHKIKVPIKKWLINEIRNIVFQIIRSFLATHIIYQSYFVQQWWNKKGWKTNADCTVIKNGVNIDKFKPAETQNNTRSLLAVEGNLDYSPYSIKLLNLIQEHLIGQSKFDSLVLYGGFQSKQNREKLNKEINYKGIVSRAKLPSVYQNAIYLSLDVNAACPNTVIEAMASGLPVIGFDTGALGELVPQEAGEIVPYGSDPWELGFPNAENLFNAALKVRGNWENYSQAARKHAEDNFDIEKIVNKYVEIIESELNR